MTFDRQRFQIRNDGFRIFMLHVIDMHGRPQDLALWTRALFQYTKHLLVPETRQPRQGRHVIGPILDGPNRSNPDRSPF